MSFLPPLGVAVSNLVRNKLLTTVPKWSREWRVSFDIKPLRKVTGYGSILHVTTGSNCCSYGSRIPGIWFMRNSFRLLVSNAVQGHGNFVVRTKKPLPVNSYSKVVVEQVKIDGRYVFRVIVNGATVSSSVNKRPAEFSNVKIYSADPWHTAANAVLKIVKFSPDVGISTISSGRKDDICSDI